MSSGGASGYRSATYHTTVYTPTFSQTVIVSRPTRMYGFYGSRYSYYSGMPVVYYNDPFHSIFWWWMLDQSLENRAMWAYHHRNEMDDARWRDMCAKDSQLEARVRELESQNIPRDSTYTPKGVDKDLMYSDKAITDASQPSAGASFWGFLKFLMGVFCVIVVGWVIVCLIRAKS